LIKIKEVDFEKCKLSLGQSLNLGVKIITDCRLLDAKNVTNTLAKLLPDTEEALLQGYSTRIIEESSKLS
jgi:hypothetical protein